MKKEMPKIGKKIRKKEKPIDIKEKLKELCTWRNFFVTIQTVLFVYISARLFIMGLSLVAPLLNLFVAILGLPEAAFTNKFLFLIITFFFVMGYLLKAIFRMALYFFRLIRFG